MIERKIIIGMIISTDYLNQIQEEWDSNYIISRTASLIAEWVWEYYEKYNKAPMRDIENIYIRKLRKTKIKKDLAEEIEQEILPGLSEEYENEGFDLKILLDDTREYFDERQVELHLEMLEALLEKNNVDKAVELAQKFSVKRKLDDETLDLSKPESLKEVKKAFDVFSQNVVKFPGALGDFWNDQLCRGRFVSFMGPEKRGKTFWLIEFMMRAYSQGKKVAYFEAGDMTKGELLMRICVYLGMKSNLKKHTGDLYLPVQDCIHNQKDTCDRKVRECGFGIFGEEIEKREDITLDLLKENYELYPDYKPCYNCVEWQKSPWGTPWLKKINIKHPLTEGQAEKLIEKFFIKTGQAIKISPHPSGSLNISTAKQKLDYWKRTEGFDPELIIFDYIDIMEHEVKGELRHQMNDTWMKMRGLSQERDALVIAPTQTDADSYEQDLLSQKNFSEDKRKYGHVSAMYGLNQDKKGREKKIGIMRLNKLVLRGDDFHYTDQVHVLQKLAIGRPFIGSYY
jgi:hypothetical protein